MFFIRKIQFLTNDLYERSFYIYIWHCNGYYPTTRKLGMKFEVFIAG